MEYKILARGDEVGSAGAKRKQKQKQKPARRRASRAARPDTADSPKWGAVYVGASEFAELESCLTKPAQPTDSIRKGAELLRRLYKNR